jgi:hypothetical protein
MELKKISYIISAKLTQGLQRASYNECRWFALEEGIEFSELKYQATGWDKPRRIVAIWQSIKRKTAPGKQLSLLADDPDINGWCYGAMVTELTLSPVEVWRTYRNGMVVLTVKTGLRSSRQTLDWIVLI